MDYQKIHTMIGTTTTLLVTAQILEEQDVSPSIKLLEAIDVIGDIAQKLLNEVVQRERVHTVKNELLHR